MKRLESKPQPVQPSPNNNSQPEHIEFSPPKQTKTNSPKPDSSEKVHFLESGAYKYMSGERVSTGIRVDSGLYSRFKQVSKHVYGSTCRAFELYMIALIETTENGVHFSDTQQPIRIEKIVIERNLRPRRSLPLQDCEMGYEEASRVERTKRPVLVKNDLPDYSKFSTEKLQKLHARFRNSGEVGKSALVVFELKKRGAV